METAEQCNEATVKKLNVKGAPRIGRNSGTSAYMLKEPALKGIKPPHPCEYTILVLRGSSLIFFDQVWNTVSVTKLTK
jgi:hypothetical protein